jgi:Leucine-rich repeat (LRR) protein
VFLGLLALAGLALWLYWPSKRDRAIARIQELDGRVLVERDESNQVLENVIFVNRPITDGDLRSISDLGAFTHLRLFLDGTKVTDASLEYLHQLPELRTLSLCNTRITDNGLRHLSGLDKLQKLSLKFCRVTDTGLNYLAELHGLEMLDLQNTQVSVAAVRQLRQNMPQLRIWHIVVDDD